MYTRVLLLIILCIAGLNSLNAQFIPENIENTGIYEYIDEMASLGYIRANQTVKPWGKEQIAQWLDEISLKNEFLNTRQKKELLNYIQAYSQFSSRGEISGGIRFRKQPLGLYYRDSLFRLSIHPLINGTLIYNGSKLIQNRWWGGSVYGTIGNHFSFYTNLTDHWETQVLASPLYLTQRIGGKYKGSANRTGGDFSTLRGGVTWGWKWGHVGFLYDRPTWGTGYNGTNIFSGRNTPFPQITMKIKPVKWFEFDYFHGWLNSELLDSTRSFTSGYDYKKVYYEKYIAANMFTFMPWKSLKISAGNSVVYSNPQVYPGFLIPTLFFRSVDENFSFIKSNSQLFFNFNLYPFKHTHLYSTIFVDEFKLERVSQSDKYNFNSLKGGLQITGWPFNNLILTTEYTRTSPITYKHQLAVLTLATNNYTMGHYLRDNSDEIFTSIEYKPFKGTSFYISYINARHGNDYKYEDEIQAVKNPVLKDIIWQNSSLKTGFNYELIAGTMLRGSVMFNNNSSIDADGISAQYYIDLFSPPYLQGKKVIFEGGLTIAF